MTASSDSISVLCDFLADHFVAEDLTAFVRALPEGTQLIRALPEPPASRAQRADALISALMRRDALGSDFFVALARALPGYQRDIEAIMDAICPNSTKLTEQPRDLLISQAWRVGVWVLPLVAGIWIATGLWLEGDTTSRFPILHAEVEARAIAACGALRAPKTVQKGSRARCQDATKANDSGQPPK